MSEQLFQSDDYSFKTENLSIFTLVFSFIATICFFLPWTVINIINPLSMLDVGDSTIKITSNAWQLLTLSAPKVKGLGSLGEMSSALYDQINLGKLMYESVDGSIKTIWTIDRIGLGLLLGLTIISLALSILQMVKNRSFGKIFFIITGVIGIILVVLTSTIGAASINTSNQDLDIILNTMVHFSNGLGYWGAILSYAGLIFTGFLTKSNPLKSLTPPPVPLLQQNQAPQAPMSERPISESKNTQALFPPWLILGIVFIIGAVIVLVVLINHQDNSASSSKNNSSINFDNPDPSTKEVPTQELFLETPTITLSPSSGLQKSMDQIMDKATLISEPENDSIKHNPSDSIIHAKKIDDNIANFVVDATYTNPYSAARSAWDYGFMFRDTGWNQHYRLIIDSNKRWLFKLRDGEDTLIIDSGKLNNLNLGDGERNRIVLICLNDVGYFSVNGVPIAKIDLSAKQQAGHLYLAISMQNEEKIVGAETPYSNVSVYLIP
ncbi:MAG: hypothetical protein VB013_15050 [Anaerolineaceae bacterium]|nr:hypothetical protein [Anaerolineaceae bacterium]